MSYNRIHFTSDPQPWSVSEQHIPCSAQLHDSTKVINFSFKGSMKRFLRDGILRDTVLIYIVNHAVNENS